MKTLLALFFLVIPARSSIAFVNSAYLGQQTASTFSAIYTVTAGNVLWVGFTVSYAPCTLTVQYNSIAMTLAETGANNGLRLFYLVNPATGANAVSLTCAEGSVVWNVGVSEYSGATTPGIPDAVAEHEDLSSPGSVAITTVAANAWAVVFASAGCSAVTANTALTLRSAGATGGFCVGMLDSGAVSPGSHTLSWNAASPTQVLESVVASFAPSSGGGGRRKIIISQ
jgi:hypothetical protein